MKNRFFLPELPKKTREFIKTYMFACHAFDCVTNPEACHIAVEVKDRNIFDDEIPKCPTCGWQMNYQSSGIRYLGLKQK